eukprot:4512269-Prymnesium_polylepis.1
MIGGTAQACDGTRGRGHGSKQTAGCVPGPAARAHPLGWVSTVCGRVGGRGWRRRAASTCARAHLSGPSAASDDARRYRMSRATCAAPARAAPPLRTPRVSRRA